MSVLEAAELNRHLATVRFGIALTIPFLAWLSGENRSPLPFSGPLEQKAPVAHFQGFI